MINDLEDEHQRPILPISIGVSEDKIIHQEDKWEPMESPSKEFPFSIFRKNEKYLLILVLSLVGFWSTVSSPIYFPAIPTLSRYFNTTDSIMNLSVVAYLVFQGIAPTFFSNIADTFGRRPVILASIIIYIASCIGLAYTNVYWLLVVLRCVQAAGIAPVISISSGISGDTCTSAERGSFVGIVSGFQLVGNGFGALIGAGLINQFNSWRAIFAFLAIGGGATLIFGIFMLPETARHLVGNGSIIPEKFFNKLPILYIPHMRKRMTNDFATLRENPLLDILAPFRILFTPEVFAILIPTGLHFASWTCVLATLSPELESSKYNYKVMHVGYIYLPQGVFCLISSLVTGKMLDFCYKYYKKAYDDKYENYDVKPQFNLYHARVVVLIIPIVSMVIGLLIFGWCIHFAKNVSSIIISTCCISYSASSFISVISTILVDMYPGRGSSLTSCVNLMRCWLAALFSGVLLNMTRTMNLGGCYTLLAGLCLISNLGLVFTGIRISKKIKLEFN